MTDDDGAVVVDGMMMLMIYWSVAAGWRLAPTASLLGLLPSGRWLS